MREKRYRFTVQHVLVLGQTQTLIVTGSTIEVAQENFWNRTSVCKHTHKITHIEEEPGEHTESE